ncbi:MAG: hypothetical protein M1274_02290 [Actinobacteria bacterium]|nr:hypothetical protein [Actinomycetota bacterium]
MGISRNEARELINSPSLLRPYFRLSDETAHAMWTYDDPPFYYRGRKFERVRPHTYLFDLREFAAECGLTEHQLYTDLKELFARGCLDALHFRIRRSREDLGDLRSAEGFGCPLPDLMEPSDDFEGRTDWMPSAVYMEPPGRDFVKMPKDAWQVRQDVLRLLIRIYIDASYHTHKVHCQGRFRLLEPGDLLLSFADLEREFGVHRRQIMRWASYASRDGLLAKIPHGHDRLWKTLLFPGPL